MEKFTRITAVAAPLLRINVDTDAIIPSREMKTVGKTGLAAGLFAGWRYQAPGSRDENPDFVLNREPYRQARILLAGANFGCGSSREHAVWALQEWGMRSIIAPSFGAIFAGNCVRNGILPVVLDNALVEDLARQVEADPASRLLTVDLVDCTVTAPDGRRHAFAIAAADREMLLEGLDGIALTMKRDDEILAFQGRDRLRRPWIYL
ncbi:MAG: 3-isopropylmalate dehydratase small subunit [Gammaproteobacteria bacterium]|jgi:3-isopropylmalate/(R)-2-methylmalate dehydratase small subunit|nr:MAG: 3-isopropylmalate dehydratase small subunit [Gammaproteobacteria bacterium]